MRKLNCCVAFVFLFFFTCETIFSQVVINEMSNANRHTIYDEENDTDDWIELYNTGNQAVNLKGYYLSDNPSKPDKWTFPEIIINPGEHLVIFASGQSVGEKAVHHWEGTVQGNDIWKYMEGFFEPDTKWNTTDFDDTSWLSGIGGIGSGFKDASLNTQISKEANSLYIRHEFTIDDLNKIRRAALIIDFKDGFVAYLNGVEIARKNMSGNRPAFDQKADNVNEPILYTGGLPYKQFYEEEEVFKLLKTGNNVLAVQVHKHKLTTEELSCTPFLSLGVMEPRPNFKSVPDWIDLKQTFFHANFKISAGEEVVLSNPQGVAIDSYVMPLLQLDNSIGRKPDGGNYWCYFGTPTPRGSNNNSQCYEGYEPEPLIELNGGFYSGNQVVNISAQSNTSIVKYTTDGKKPNIGDATYTQPIQVEKTITLSARAISSENKLPSQTVRQTYFIDENFTVPVVSISTDPGNLWDENYGIYVKGPNASSEFPFFGANFWQKWERESHVEIFDREKKKVVDVVAGLRIHGGHSRGFEQKGLRIHCRGAYGFNVISYPLIPDKPEIENYKRVIFRNSGQDFYRARMRDALLQRLVRASHLDYQAYEPAVIFLNGEYWGLYDIRERVDKHYLAYNHKVNPDQVDMLEHSGYLKVVEGSDSDFVEMHDQIMAANPEDPGFYNQISNRLDLQNFADFFITQTFYSNQDWIGDQTGNMKLWRSQEEEGKWRYFIHDVDFSFGLRTGSKPDDNTLVVARYPNAGNEHSRIFDKMLRNEKFRHYFINRYADLMNTFFHSNNMESLISEFQDFLEPEMPRQVQRWDYGIATWYDEVDYLAQFAKERIPFAREHVQNEFNLVKQVNVTLDVFPPGAGQIQISTIVPDSLPWEGIYYDGVPVTIKAIPNEWYSFKYWEKNGLIENNTTTDSITLNISSDEKFVAYFDGSPGVEDDENGPFRFFAYPNPSNDDMTVNIFSDTTVTDMISFEVVNLIGKTVLSEIIPPNHQMKLRKADYANGIYFIRLRNGDKTYSKKVVFF
jgi:hypothetical protein